jgi:hypothetical protein
MAASAPRNASAAGCPGRSAIRAANATSPLSVVFTGAAVCPELALAAVAIGSLVIANDGSGLSFPALAGAVDTAPSAGWRLAAWVSGTGLAVIPGRTTVWGSLEDGPAGWLVVFPGSSAAAGAAFGKTSLRTARNGLTGSVSWPEPLAFS